PSVPFRSGDLRADEIPICVETGQPLPTATHDSRNCASQIGIPSRRLQYLRQQLFWYSFPGSVKSAHKLRQQEQKLPRQNATQIGGSAWAASWGSIGERVGKRRRRRRFGDGPATFIYCKQRG